MNISINDEGLPKSSITQEYSANETIANEGDTETGWYVLLEGKVGVYKHSKKVAEFDQRGVVFGELSGILNTTRTASLRALERTRVVYFKATLDQLITLYPYVAKKIMVNLAERLAKTTDELIFAVEKDQKEK